MIIFLTWEIIWSKLLKPITYNLFNVFVGMGMIPMKLESGDLLPPPPPPHYPGFSAAMAAAVAANQQLAMMTSQGIPFLPHTMPALYTSPSGLMFAAPPGFNHHHAALMSNGLLESARASMLGAGDHGAGDALLARR